NKMFLTGNALNAFKLLVELGLLEHLFPDLATVLQEEPQSSAIELVRLGLQGTDERVRADKSVTPTFLFAVLLWPAMQRAYAQAARQDGAEVQQLLAICEEATARQQARVAIPKRFTLPMREVIGLQPRFERREGRRALRLLDHPRFRAAYDFLLLRAAAGEVDTALAQWWTEIQTLPADQKIARVADGEPGQRTQSRRPRRRKRRRGPRPPVPT
ncbi:MAG: polynucleotide adenylyltransferase PcnB, partial [Steroidobacteraceae bacterium]